RYGVEVHDLVQTYESRSEYVDFSRIPFHLGAFNDWLDPFDLISGQFFEGWEPPIIFTEFTEEQLIGEENYLLTNSRSTAAHHAFETSPFLMPEIDTPPNGPRSPFFPAQLPLPSRPTYATWPATL